VILLKGYNYWLQGDFNTKWSFLCVAFLEFLSLLKEQKGPSSKERTFASFCVPVEERMSDGFRTTCG